MSARLVISLIADGDTVSTKPFEVPSPARGQAVANYLACVATVADVARAEVDACIERALRRQEGRS